MHYFIVFLHFSPRPRSSVDRRVAVPDCTSESCIYKDADADHHRGPAVLPLQHQDPESPLLHARARRVRDREDRVREGHGGGVRPIRRREALLQTLVQGRQDHQGHQDQAAAAAAAARREEEARAQARREEEARTQARPMQAHTPVPVRVPAAVLSDNMAVRLRHSALRVPHQAISAGADAATAAGEARVWLPGVVVVVVPLLPAVQPAAGHAVPAGAPLRREPAVRRLRHHVAAAAHAPAGHLLPR